MKYKSQKSSLIVCTGWLEKKKIGQKDRQISREE